MIYNVFFHPLKRFPGPKLWAASQLPRQFYEIRGTLDFKIRDLHDRYGHAVRLEPNLLSFTDSAGWKDIHGYGAHNLEKDPGLHNVVKRGVKEPGIVQADAPNHARIRRQLAHAFSEKAMRDQEPIISGYVDTLISQLKDVAASVEKTNIMRYFQYTTIDITSELSFGTSFNVLHDARFRDWVGMQGKMGKIVTAMRFVMLYPALAPVFRALIPKKTIDGMIENRVYIDKVVSQRIEEGVMEERRDFWSYMLKNKDKDSEMTKSEMCETARSLINAGAETTKTLLSAVTFYLLNNPEWMQRVVQEVRFAFEKEEDINFVDATNKLPLMLACLEEGLRLHPPAASLLGARQTPPNTYTTILGQALPPSTIVDMHPLSSFTCSANFHEARSFRPERFLPEASKPGSPFAEDDKFAFQPFFYGPRNCIGRNLAFNKMRLILARVLWNFDLSLCPESQSWDTHKIWIGWEDTPLWVTLKSRTDV